MANNASFTKTMMPGPVPSYRVKKTGNEESKKEKGIGRESAKKKE